MSSALEITNARIWTGETSRPAASSLRIEHGRVVALDQPATSGPGTTTIDADGRTVVPGLIDGHLHLLLGGRALSQLDLSKVRSQREFEATLAERHQELPAGQWLIAHGWSSENWNGEDRAAEPDRSWLAAAGDRPVACYRMDLHAALVNDAVLRQCDLSTAPPGGRIVRDATGAPTGLLLEAAAWSLVNPLIPEATATEKQTQLLAAQQHAHAMGLTAVGSMEYSRDVLEVFQPLRDRLTLRCAITLLDRAWPMKFDRLKRVVDVIGLDDDRLRVIGCKAFIDGTLGSRTARMLEDYADKPGERGMLVDLAAEGRLIEWAVQVAQRGWSPSMHAIGDEAVRLALNAADEAERANPRPEAAPRLEHVQTVHPDDLPRFRKRIASMQPLHKADDGRYALRRLGPSRMNCFFPFRTLEKAGASLAFGSDWPVVSCDPLAGMRTAITGLTMGGEPCRPEEVLSVESVLRAYTVGAARALQMKGAGMLQVGFVGDCVMLDRDPFDADWVNQPPRVVMTVTDGEVRYDARPSSTADKLTRETQR